MFTSSISLPALAICALTAALPDGYPRGWLSSDSGPGCASPIPQPVLPVNPDSEQLPTPDARLQLKRIALGYGIQNYTCESRNASATATGALAGLYDITHLYPGQGHDSLKKVTFDHLTSVVMAGAPSDFPLALVPDLEDRVPRSNPGADPDYSFLPAAPLPVPCLGISLPCTGQHFFNESGVPVFKLDGGPTLFGKVLHAFPAPQDADPGRDNVGAVDWLRLGALEGSKGLEFVYRVQTAGGKSHGCAEGGGNDSSYYTAAYWFYG